MGSEMCIRDSISFHGIWLLSCSLSRDLSFPACKLGEFGLDSIRVILSPNSILESPGESFENSIARFLPRAIKSDHLRPTERSLI